LGYRARKQGQSTTNGYCRGPSRTYLLPFDTDPATFRSHVVASSDSSRRGVLDGGEPVKRWSGFYTAGNQGAQANDIISDSVAALPTTPVPIQSHFILGGTRSCKRSATPTSTSVGMLATRGSNRWPPGCGQEAR